ncbi:MAG: hypothetical protein U9R08_06610 [Nanoarchaeota archaeon]|nr:hypothetical protein [Nanoarchaeota archaeon]
MKTKLLIISLILLLLFIVGCTDASFKSECGNEDNFLMSIGTSYRCIDKHTIAFCKSGHYYETHCEAGCEGEGVCGCDKSTYVQKCTENGDLLTCTETGQIYPERCLKGCSDGECNTECPKGTTWGRGEDYKFTCMGSPDSSDSSDVCADPTFDSKCVTKNDVLICEDGKSRIERCEYGCFEAVCRDTKGPTDKENECVDDSYCDSNEVCESGECITDNECDYNSDCDTGYSCIDFECVIDSECKTDSDCETNEVCESGECITDNECDYNSDCDTGYSCIDFECVIDSECKTDSDCETNEVCESGECTLGCEDTYDCDVDEICKDNKCILGCEDEDDCGVGYFCESNKCVKSEKCIDDFDCEINFECKKEKCVSIPECTEGTLYCGSSEQLIYCDDETLQSEICEFGCKDANCMTEKQKLKLDKETEEKANCDEKFGKCLTGNKIEFCLDGKIHTGFCEFGCEKDSCLVEKKCPWYNPFCDKSGDSSVLDYKDVVSEKFMNGLDKEISKQTDPAKIRGLKKYKEFLEKAGTGMETAQTTYEDLMTIKKIFVDSYDPSMDIENMKPGDILKKSFTEKVGDSFDKLKFWKGKKTPFMVEQDKADEQLKVYKAMLERQEENNFLKSSRKDRLVNTFISRTKGKAVTKLTDEATGIAEDIAGPAFMTVGMAKQAIDAVKDESEKMMYTGLIKAYNKRREAFERDFPDKSDEEIHEMTKEEVIEDPYRDDPKFTRMASYGNLVLQRECGESHSKLCIDRKVFFTAMEKSYNHLNGNRLFDRRMEQLDKRLKK